LSVLPLHHAFGLIIDFLPALFAGAEIVRVADYGRNLDALMQTAEVHGITHCSMVPLLAQRLAQSERGRSFLCGLQGGVIGGAPVRAELVPLLRQTRLRVGYGQTEASPGITLGEAGFWTANYLGKTLANPLGCEVRINADSVLEFRGANACMGAWTADGFVPFPPDRWHATGDIVQTSNDAALEGYVFVGRADDNFKLSNGRFIPAVHWEHLLKHRIESCVEAMITTLDGEHCTIALLHDNHSSEDALRLIISDVLNIQPYVMATIHNLTREEWCFTPKGSTDRQAMKRLLETLSNPHR
jgi:acyl-CoA synthetase (AMP-forming)/AMP-acid ligase II